VNSATVEPCSTVNWKITTHAPLLLNNGAMLLIGKLPREAAKCCFSKPVAQQRKLVGPTKKNCFFFCYQTLVYVATGEPHPQPHYQTAF
jgi:hypothetical protein